MYSAIFGGVNGRALRRAMLPSKWCRRRDAAMLRASRALLSLRVVLAESTADPGLLLLAFEGVEREFRRFLHEASSNSPPDPRAYDGRAAIVRELLAGSPKRLGWVKGGRPVAVWQVATGLRCATSA